MNETPDYFVDIRGLTDDSDSVHAVPPGGGLAGRPWLGIRFDCCGVYTRVYRNVEGTVYRGACPRCGRAVVIRVGEGGTSARFFVAE